MKKLWANLADAILLAILLGGFAFIINILYATTARAEDLYSVPVVVVHQGEGVISFDAVDTTDPMARLCLFKRGENTILCYRSTGERFVTEGGLDFGEIISLGVLEITPRPSETSDHEL